TRPSLPGRVYASTSARLDHRRPKSRAALSSSMTASKSVALFLIPAILLATLFVYDIAYAAAYAGVDDFDSYATGDLTGENGGSGFGGAWSGHTNFDVTTAQFFSSPNSVSVTSASNNNIIRDLTASVDSGNLY